MIETYLGYQILFHYLLSLFCSDCSCKVQTRNIRSFHYSTYFKTGSGKAAFHLGWNRIGRHSDAGMNNQKSGSLVQVKTIVLWHRLSTYNQKRQKQQDKMATMMITRMIISLASWEVPPSPLSLECPVVLRVSFWYWSMSWLDSGDSSRRSSFWNQCQLNRPEATVSVVVAILHCCSSNRSSYCIKNYGLN